MKKTKLIANQTEQVDLFMTKLDHPFKAEVQMIREIIKLEGDYDHRRMAYFADQNDIQVKKQTLEKALKDLIKLQPKSTGERIKHV